MKKKFKLFLISSFLIGLPVISISCSNDNIKLNKKISEENKEKDQSPDGTSPIAPQKTPEDKNNNLNNEINNNINNKDNEQPKPIEITPPVVDDKNDQTLKDQNKQNNNLNNEINKDSNQKKLDNQIDKKIKDQVEKIEFNIKNADSHFLSYEFLKSKTPYEIIKQTQSYKKGLEDINNFLYHGNNGQAIDYRSGYNPDKVKEFWKYTKNVGVYGNYGKTDEEKIAFYNDSISTDGMIIQKYLSNFQNNERYDTNQISISTNVLENLIKQNPFGFLPSNLSQLLHYMDFESIEKIFALKNIKEVKSNFDDEKGTFELLIFDKNNNKHYLNISAQEIPSLKKNFDFIKYIYDRSFTVTKGTVGWKIDPFFSKQNGLKAEINSGTMWVMDRIINPELEKKDQYELLIATNIHVFSLQSVFDKSIYFEKNSNNSREKEWNAGFWDPIASYNVDSSGKIILSNNRSLVNFTGTRGEFTYPTKNNIPVFTRGSGNYFPTFNAYSQYLDAPYYTPRYKATGIFAKNITVGPKFLEEYNKETRHRATKNAGADFVLLRLKIHKQNLKNILPDLEWRIGTPEEKNWYIGVGKNELFSPIKTQFYGGYPATINDNFEPQNSLEFKYNKSIGGIINAQTRVIDEDNYKPLWVRYKENENKDWNSHNENWKKYTEPFIKNEHGMPKWVLTQHSQLYTHIPYEKRFNALTFGSSGSMAIDSSFNLIGINYLFTQDSTYNTYTNGISLMEGHSTYSDGFNGNIREDIIKKIKNDNLETVKINPKNKV
ncbi:MAG2960 family serine endopeptidase lipoprotein [Metamycoplasma canadense]|nr:lipoprotein [Metamycoplasma canadense]